MRLLLCPLSSPGFLFPAVAIGLELQGRGHDVAFVAPARLSTFLSAQGLRRLSGPREVGLETSAWHAPAAVAAQVRGLDAALERFRADVLVTSALALGPLIAGERRRIPVGVVGLLGPLLPAEERRRSEMQAAWDAGRAAVGLSPAPAERLRGDLLLRRSVPELTDARPLIGACLWEPPTPPAVGRWLAAARRSGDRVLYVHQARTFGAPGFWPHLAAALPAGVRVAASTSRMESPGRHPGALIGPLVAQGAVLAQADAVVCSGNTTVALGALSAGRPLLTIPAGNEQHDVGAIIERAGAGLCDPDAGRDPARLRVAIERVLAHPPPLALQRALDRIDGPSRAAELVVGLP